MNKPDRPPGDYYPPDDPFIIIVPAISEWHLPHIVIAYTDGENDEDSSLNGGWYLFDDKVRWKPIRMTNYTRVPWLDCVDNEFEAICVAYQIMMDTTLVFNIAGL